MRVLIVDDRSGIQGMLIEQGSQLEFEVATAKDGLQALAMIESKWMPDLLLLNARLSNISGFEVCRRLRRCYSILELPILIVTDQNRFRDVIAGFAAGANDCLRHPLNAQLLKARINTLLMTKKLNTNLQQEISIRKQVEKELHTLNVTLEQRINKRTRELSALYEVSTVASRHTELNVILTQALERVLSAMQSQTGAIYLLEDRFEKSDPVLVNNHVCEEQPFFGLRIHQGVPQNLLPQIDPLPMTQEVVQQVIQNREPLLIPNLINTSPIFVNSHTNTPLTCLLAPMRAKGQVFGILGIIRSISSPFNVDEISLSASIADQLGIVVDSTQMRHLAEQAAISEERQRLARDLHDSVTQSLIGLTLMTEVGQAMSQTDSSPSCQSLALDPTSSQVDTQEQEKYSPATNRTEIQNQFAKIGKTARQAIKEMRLFIHQLRPSILEQEGLVTALHQRLEAVEGQADIQACLQVDEMIRLPDFIEETFYHIAQEALNNALRHAQAKLVQIQIYNQAEYAILEINDDGCGFDPNSPNSGGLGLQNMRERTEQLNGIFQLLSRTGGGTTIISKVRMKH